MPHDTKTGYGLLSGLDDIAEQPARPRLDPQERRELQRKGEAQGFANRNPAIPLRMRRERAGTAILNVRITPEEFNRFANMAHDARMGRADFIVALMDAYEREQGRGR